MWKQTIVLVVLVACTSGQSTTTPATETTGGTAAPQPEVVPKLKDYGLALTTFDDWGQYGDPDDPPFKQMRHLLGFPGIDKNLQESDSRGLSFTNQDIHLLSIDADVINRTVYMYDYHYGIVVIGSNYSSAMNTSEMEFKIFHHVMSIGSVQIAYDWLSGTLYWVDPQVKMIAAAPGQWAKVENDTYAIIANDHLEHPDGIAVDPMNGYVFWSDNGRHPKIERALLNGLGRHTIVWDNLKSPMTLEVDIPEKRLYWIDTWTESIVSSTYDGERTFIARMGGLLFDMAIYKDLLYVSDIDNYEMYTLDKKKGTKKADAISYWWDDDETIYGVTAFAKEKQPTKPTDYCANLNCEHMCVSMAYSAKCMCGVGYKLNMNTNKCDLDKGRRFKAFVFANSSHICLTDIRSVVSPGFFEIECIVNMIKMKPVPTTNTPPVNRRKRQAPDSTNTTTTEVPTRQTRTPPAPTTKAPNSTTPTPTTTPTTTTTTIPPPTVAPADRIKKIELDMHDRFVFFVTENEQIYKKSIDNKEEPMMLVQGSNNVTGLAFDYMDGALFWSQSDGRIFLYELNSKEVTEITQDIKDEDKPKNPRSLIIIVEKRILAFIAGDDGEMGIYTIKLDGSKKVAILEDYGSMTSLIYEKETELFYFLNTGKGRIGSVPLDKSVEAESVSTAPDVKAYILLEYHNYFIWVYTSGEYPNLIMSAEKSRPYVPVGHYYFDNVSTIVDMKILDAERQLTNRSLCGLDNGGCEHICISLMENGKPSKACKCKKGFELDKNKMNCTSIPAQDNFLCMLDWTNDEIIQITFPGNELKAIPAQDSYYYIGMHLDPDTMRVWWSAYYDSYIYSSFLNGSNTKREADLTYSYPHKFVKDSSTGNMYYTTYFYQEVGVVSKNGGSVLLYDEFYYEDLNAIEIHPGKGYIYLAVSGYFESYIARGYMDGTNITKLELTHREPNKTNLVVHPEGLAIDYVNERLFIGDYEQDTILQCDLDGQDCITIVNTTDEKITDLVTDGSNICYTAYQKDYVKCVELIPPHKHVTLGQHLGLGKVNTISYYSSTNPNKQPASKGCNKNNGLGDCSDICLPTGNPVNQAKRTCACPNNVPLHEDGRTCSNLHMCIPQIKHYNPETNETIKITFEDDCLRRLNSTCKFTCPPNYVVANKSLPTLTCKVDGWDRETDQHILCEEIRCPSTFNEGAVTEGTVTADCTRNVGSVCNFTCKPNFEKSQKVLFCKEDGQWHAEKGAVFCEPYKCDASITHGKLDAACDRTIGTKCNFMCEDYYDFTPPKKISEITCENTGWNMNTSLLCSDARCHDKSLSNGKVSADCSKIVGRSCNYSCDRSYTNSSAEVVCKADKMWHPAQACETLYCPIRIQNANVSKTCDRKVDSVCTYFCQNPYKAVDKKGQVKCLPSGSWNQSNLCLEAIVKGPEGLSANQKGGLIGGIVVAAIVVIVLIILVVFLMRRRKASLAYATASYKNGSNVAIENPGYRETSMQLDVKDDHPYSSVDPNQMQPDKFQEQKRGEAVNPMYDNEPLPEVAQVEVNQDKAVLTYDSWLKEREKEKM